MDPKTFYKNIGIKGLASMTSEERTKAYVGFVQRFLSQNDRILDVGCGYGRVAIPLAKMGYRVEGIDISTNLIEEARRQIRSEGLVLEFKIGDMRDLPYEDESFNVVACLWSTFSYMLTKQDQIQALSEMYRVLAEYGTMIIDLPVITKNSIKDGEVIGPNILKRKLMGAEHTVYLHTKETLNFLLRDIKEIKTYEISYHNIGKRRLCVFIQK